MGRDGGVRSWWARHALTRRCLVAWLLMVPVVVAVQPLDGRAGTLVRELVNSLAGSFSAVVLGALFVERWRAGLSLDRARAERDAWVVSNVRFVESEHQLLLADVARMVVEVYRFPAVVLEAGERVPDELLVWDVTARPEVYTDAVTAGRFLDQLLVGVSGPLATVCSHARVVPSAARLARMHAIDRSWGSLYAAAGAEDLLDDEPPGGDGLASGGDGSTVDGMGGSASPGGVGRASWSPARFRDRFPVEEGVARALVASAPAVAGVVGRCADRVYEGLRDLASLELYRPLRENAQEFVGVGARGGQSAAHVLAAARQVRVCAEQFQEAAESVDGDADDVPAQLLVLCDAAFAVVGGVREVRRVLLEQGRSVTATIAELDRQVGAFVGESSTVGSQVRDVESKELWRAFQERNRVPAGS